MNKKNIFLFVTYTIIQSITSSEICALLLTLQFSSTILDSNTFYEKIDSIQIANSKQMYYN